MNQINEMPAAVEKVLETMEPVRELALQLKDAKSVLFLGRHVGYPVALEGALKLKELAYMHAEGFAAGELKHGPIALIEEGVPVVVIVPSPTARHRLHDKIVSNIQEVRARGARTIVIAEEGDEAVVPYADHLIRVPAGADAAAAAGHHRAAAGVRLRDGPGQGLRRRPAPQPRQVRHRRVAGPRPPSGRHAPPLVAGRRHGAWLVHDAERSPRRCQYGSARDRRSRHRRLRRRAGSPPHSRARRGSARVCSPRPS